MRKISRRSFIGSATSAAAGGLLVPPAAAVILAEADSPILPWEREVPLREGARSAVIEGILHPTDPTPNVLGLHPGSEQTLTMAITNPAIRAALWGPTHRITLSMLKTDVQDRRVKWPSHEVTLKEIREGALSPVNKEEIHPKGKSTRPAKGYLKPAGGRSAPYIANWHAYPFPCQKPVGQIILILDDLEGAAAPKLTQSCANGLMGFHLEKGNAHADMEIVLSMTRNVFALRGAFSGFTSPVKLRLYRHQDQAHLQYMNPDGSFRAGVPESVSSTGGAAMALDGHAITYDYATDAAWNGQIEPPESGVDGRYFWIKQRLPAEKTFPHGFSYVMMGLVSGSGHADLAMDKGKSDLGTPPPEKSIRSAPGSAVTAAFAPQAAHRMTSYVVIVSEIDAADFMAEARKRLDQAETDGFDRIVQQNTHWYEDHYNQRENGRVFYGKSGRETTEDIADAYSSWYCHHGGGCKTDMRRYQASAHYSEVEIDAQRWHGYPCYNEWFYTPSYVRNRADSVDMWKQLTEHWWEASRANARQVFDMPGMAMMHGYFPPIKADKYVHTNVAMELCIDTQAQILKSLWDEWDYGGDLEFLKRVYPMLRDMALFYAAYAKRADGDRYHFVPAMQAECWGIYPDFSHSIDAIGALCMSRWALLRVADAAELLGQDASLRDHWREIAKHIAQYPTWDKPEGTIFAGVRGIEPFWSKGDHPWYEGAYPTTLADDLNLDSSAVDKATMVRTATLIKAAPNAEVLVLLAACPETIANVQTETARPILDWKTLRAEINRYPERLLNSRSGRIHLFPCVPLRSVVAFRKFQAQSGFLVSAARNEQGIYFVEIEARRTTNCSLMNPWPGWLVTVRNSAQRQTVPVTHRGTNGECITFAAQKTSKYLIERGAKVPV